MENLSLADGPPPPGHSPLPLGPGTPGAATPQLPPQMFTTAAQLLDLTDKKLLVVLRDGRKLLGVLRSWDQFANIVLQSTTERIFAPPTASTTAAANANATSSSSSSTKTNTPSGAANPDDGRALYADIPHGLFLVRGENVLLLGEIDLDRDDDPPPGYERAEPALVRRLAAARRERERERARTKNRRLATLGFEGENLGEILL